MSVADVFRGFIEGSAPPPQRIQIVPGSTNLEQAAVPTNGTLTNTTVPNDKTPQSDGSLPAIPKAGEGDKSPLANFEKLFTVEKSDVAQTSLKPNFKLDQKEIMANAKNIDFAGNVSQAAKDAATKGDYSLMINESGQFGFANAAMLTGTMLENALAKMTDTFEKQVLPERLKQHDIRNQLGAANPMFDNPAVRPLINMVENQFRTKNPTASATEITNLAKQYVTEMSEAVLSNSGKVVTDKPSEKTTGPGAVKQDTDWGAYFSDNA